MLSDSDSQNVELGKLLILIRFIKMIYPNSEKIIFDKIISLEHRALSFLDCHSNIVRRTDEDTTVGYLHSDK